jgi:acyl carrier protein
VSSINDAIREVISSAVHLTVDVETLGDDDNLYLVGLTSHGVVNVLVELEDRLEIELPDALLQRDTFASISALRNAVVSTGLVEDDAPASSA